MPPSRTVALLRCRQRLMVGNQVDALYVQLAWAYLHALRAMLVQSDMQALEVFARLRATHGATLGDALNDLHEAMDILDFEGAAQHCTFLLGVYPNDADAGEP